MQDNWWLWIVIVILLLILLWWILGRFVWRNKTAGSLAHGASAAATAESASASGAASASGSGSSSGAAEASAAASTTAPASDAHAVKLAGTPAETADLPDLDEGRAALGSSRRLDPNDLTIVEGIGPKIAGILNDAGISTWQDLASTEVSAIQRLLDEAGPRYNMHRPGTWPQQAGLLRDGKWEEFKALTDNLKGGVAE